MQDRFGTFSLLINRISRNIYRIKNKEIAAFNLKSTHVSCLYHLYKNDGLTATDLCQRCEEDKAAVSRSLDYLEKNEYVICKSEQPKRYKSPFYLTAKGREVGKEIIDKIDKILDAVGSGLTEEERALFYRYLSSISNSLENIANNL
ncbi:MAG TPA: MarR family transcriptional regulator [Erysipelotrichaceae bacterium]|nr:MarR family transcriptional regulator [Erysipelotrichaceae bacterium]HQB32581.1 MarR family transcriptional regulator [Erysipelotrichaceae bacterium]